MIVCAGALSLAASAAAQAPPVVFQQPLAAPPLASGPAAGAVFPAAVKIAFVDLQRIANESSAGKAVGAQLKAVQDAASVRIQAKLQIVKTLQDRQATASVLTPQAATQIQKDLDRAQLDLQYTQQVAQKDVEDAQRDLMGALSDKVMPIVEQVRAEKGLWAVWALDETLVSMMPGLDISADVVARLDTVK
jgi:Skp family chaperone for outer membrane proteins